MLPQRQRKRPPEDACEIRSSAAGRAAASNVGALLDRRSIGDLKRRSVRGAALTLSAQAFKFVLQTGSLILFARLLTPEDYGVQGMVVAMTGFLSLFRDAGLSAATVQSDVLSREQLSTLFWINVGVGIALMLAAAAGAPVLANFYREPRLYSVTMVSALAFALNGLGIQHNALLQRSMRFQAMVTIDLLSLTMSSALGIVLALIGFGYWALVWMAVSAAFISAVGAWVAVPWLPGMPTRNARVRSLLHFGGTVTCNSLVVYLAYNVEKILLGRFWGAEALGLYGRAYQLINLPIQQVHSSLYNVAFPALAHIQNDAERLRRSFLRGYSILLSVILPVVIACAVFSEDIIRVLLSQKWAQAAPILRLLMPMAVGFALMNPWGWFLVATGRAARSLHIAFVIAPLVILAVLTGVHGGPTGVALWYSLAVSGVTIPVVAWSIHDTGISFGDYWRAIKGVVIACALAGTAAMNVRVNLVAAPPLSRLMVGLLVIAVVYLSVLLMPRERRRDYADLLNQVFRRRLQVAPELNSATEAQRA